MGRLGWIALTVAAMGGGLFLHSEDVRDGVVFSEGDAEDQLSIAEARIAEVEAKIEERVAELETLERDIGESVSTGVDDITRDEGDDVADEAAPATETEDARVANLIADLERMRDDGVLTATQFEQMVAQLEADQPETAAE